MYMYTYVYVYIYIERERGEGERETGVTLKQIGLSIYIYHVLFIFQKICENNCYESNNSPSRSG